MALHVCQHIYSVAVGTFGQAEGGSLLSGAAVRELLVNPTAVHCECREPAATTGNLAFGTNFDEHSPIPPPGSGLLS